MPVVSVNALEIDEKQKKTIAREYTRILSRVTNVPEQAVYVFFSGYPLHGIAAGGVLNSVLSDNVLSTFNIKYAKHLEKPNTITVLTRAKAQEGMEEHAEQAALEFVEKTRREPGCISYDLYRSKRNIYLDKRTKAYFVLQERFRGMEGVGEHMESEHFKTFMSQSEKLFDGGFEVTSKISGPSRNTAEISENNVKLIVKMKAKPETVDVIKRGHLHMKRLFDRFEDCLQYDVYQGFEGIYDTNVFFTDQIWKNRKSLDDAISYILTEMPFYFEDLAESREPMIFELASDLPEMVKEKKDIPHLSENAVLADQELIEGLQKMDKDFAELCLDTSGKAYETPLIDQRTKILFAIVIDVVEQIKGQPFENHLMMAKKQGVRKEELFELLLFLTIYVGFNKAGAYYGDIAKFYG